MQGNTEAFVRGRRRALTMAAVVAVGVTWALAGCGPGDTTQTEGRPVTNGSGSPEPTATSTPTDAAAPTTTAAGSPTTPTEASAPTTSTSTATTSGVVSHVVDGDTVDVTGIGRIRVIGIDTPESGACGYEQASALMRQLVLGHPVTLTAAPAKDNADTYGRLLRYVDVGGVDAGLAEVKAGFATARYDSRDGYGAHPREASYVAADQQVPDYTCTSAAAPAPAAPATPAGKAAAGSAAAKADTSCDPAYPTVCIPPAPPDLDCKDVPYKRFAVKAPDPHRFDADHDGIGCE